MIEIKLDNGITSIYLPQVDHMTTAESATQVLWDGVYDLAKIYGGFVTLLSPDDLGFYGYGVKWHQGPSQWADAYIVCEGADARGFVATAQNGDTVIFKDTD